MNDIKTKKKGNNVNIIVDINQGDSMTVTELIEALNKCPDKEAQVVVRTCLGYHNLYGLTANNNGLVDILWYQD